ncbi:MAG: MFS transporter, partial [Dehalococcoidia bacterium]
MLDWPIAAVRCQDPDAAIAPASPMGLSDNSPDDMTLSTRTLRWAAIRPPRPEYKWLVLGVVSLGSFMTTLDASTVAVSLPKLQVAFDVSPSTALWVVTSYLLTSMGLLLVVGRLSDALGRRLWYTGGVFVFTLGLGLASSATTIAQIVPFRVLTAVGAAMLLSSGVALITACFGDHERGKAMGFLGLMVSAGLAVGPLTGGPILDALGWRATFYLRVPIGAVGVILAWTLLQEGRALEGRFRFDALGALTIVAGLVSVVLAMSQASAWGLTSPAFLSLVIFGGLMLAVFAATELRVPQPLFDLHMFRSRVYSSSVGSMILYFAAVASAYYLLPFYLIQGREYSSTVAGLVFAIYPITMMLVSPLAGMATDRLGSRLPVAAGLVVIVVSLVLIGGLGERTALAFVAIAMVVIGLGSGIVEPSNNSALMGAASRERLSVAAASLAISRQMGLVLGIALGSAIFASRQRTYELTHSSEGALVQGFQDAVLFTAGLAVAA